jgi:hypothetical protein
VKAARFSIALALLTAAFPVAALDLSENPERSFLFAFELGAGLELDERARRPLDGMSGGHPEAYEIESFLFGLYGAYRFDEVFGLEGGWHQQRHDAAGAWGTCWYQIGHLAVRLAVPTATRQTPVFLLGPALGGFFFGSASPYYEEENGAFVLGGIAGARLEHELSLGVVAELSVAYLPLYRFGMGDRLRLNEHYWVDGEEQVETVSVKDFGSGRVVHELWIQLGLQFEWTFR